MAGSDGELAKLQGWLGIFPSHRQDVSQAPGTVTPGQAALSLRKAGPQRRERAAMSQEAGEYCVAHQMWGEGNLIVNGNRWPSSQEKRWKKMTKTIIWRMVGLKAGKLREAEGNILPLVMKDLSLIQEVQAVCYQHLEDATY